MTARHIPSGQIPPPERVAEGTDSCRYHPMPGDVVDVDCRGFRPALNMHGTRLATVRRPTGAHSVEMAFVTLPGYERDEMVDVDWLTLVRRAAP